MPHSPSEGPHNTHPAPPCCPPCNLQAACYALLLSEGWPTPEEAEVLRWAANSSSVAPPKHATRQQYKQATALEALVSTRGVCPAGWVGQHVAGTRSCDTMMHRDGVTRSTSACLLVKQALVFATPKQAGCGFGLEHKPAGCHTTI